MASPTKKKSKRALEPSTNALEVLGQFRIIIKAVRSHYRDIERSAGISGAQLWALSHIEDHPGCTVGHLAKGLALHISTASNLIRGLESLALVKRVRANADDQRVVQVQVTARGRSIMKKAPRPVVGVLQQALSRLPTQRVAMLNKELDALIRCMRHVSKRARTTPLSEM